MKIGALIITTGLPRISGVAALLSEAGSISAGQRMISSFQCVGVSMVGLVVGPEDKKAERQIAQNGVIFLRCQDPQTDFFQGLKTGLRFMQDKFDRIFVVPGDTPFFLPATLRSMLQQNAPMIRPENQNICGFPLLLDKQAAALIAAQPSEKAARLAAAQHALPLISVPVDDSGILLRGDVSSCDDALVRQHNIQLSRPVAEVRICSGEPLYDPRLSMLLRLVEDTRSVRDACNLMQISYSAAWNLLNRVEDELGYPLVVRIRGGSSGSGSILTEKGKLLMDAYERFSEQLNHTARLLYSEIFEPIATE